MLVRAIKQMIKLGRTDGLKEKIDVFYTVGTITAAEWTELSALLS